MPLEKRVISKDTRGISLLLLELAKSIGKQMSVGTELMLPRSGGEGNKKTEGWRDDGGRLTTALRDL